MTYTPNPTWTANTVITAEALDNLETQYDEAHTYLTSHNHDAAFFTKSYMDSTYWNTENDGPGSGLDADLIFKDTGNLHAASLQGLGVISGLIILWSGSIESIPSGWLLCNGSNGTPDLRDRFVMGAGTTNPGTTGGSATFTAGGTITVDAHVLTIAEMGSHRHPWANTTYVSLFRVQTTGSEIVSTSEQSGTTSAAGGGGGHTHSSAEGTSFTGSPVASMPHYYALAYIMKT